MEPYAVTTGEAPIFHERQHVAFFGRSNVGKSSTINMLLGKNIARSSSRPGKTVTFNFYEYNESTFFIDLPGYGFARGGTNTIEKLRRRLIWYMTESGAHIALIVLILDIKAGLTEADESLLKLASELEKPVLIAINKIDKLNQSDRHQAIRLLHTLLQHYSNVVAALPISARTGSGREKVINVINQHLET